MRSEKWLRKYFFMKSWIFGRKCVDRRNPNCKLRRGFQLYVMSVKRLKLHSMSDILCKLSIFFPKVSPFLFAV
jgi:hypothetical protein